MARYFLLANQHYLAGFGCWLGQYELFHIVAHMVIFAGVALLLGAGQGSEARVWSYTLGGGLLLEMTVMREAREAGIPVVVVDSAIDPDSKISSGAVTS
mgnify:CR=1 FL=1